MKDGKVFITPNEWFVPIEKAYPELETEYNRLELDETLDISTRNARFAELILSWGRLLDKFRTINWKNINFDLQLLNKSFSFLTTNG